MSKSYLYGRPVTEWSTPPPMSSKTETFFPLDPQPQVSDISTEPTRTREVTTMMEELKMGGDAHNPSSNPTWQPLTTIATPSHAKPLPYTSTVSHTTPYTSTVSHTTPNVEDFTSVYQHSPSSHIGGISYRSHKAPSTVTSSMHDRHFSSGHHLQGEALRRSASERQGYKPPRPDTSKPFHSSGSLKPPTAKVAPLVGTPSKHTITTAADSRRSTGSFPFSPTLKEKEHLKMVLSVDQPPIGGDPLSEPLGSAEKWKALIDTKDRILAQKNHLIERQKQAISKLQQDLIESEARLHQLALSGTKEGGLTVKIQQLEAENATLKAAYAETLTANETKVERLTKKLDAAEYELQKSVHSLTSTIDEANKEVVTLKGKLQSKDRLIQELEQRLEAAHTASDELKKHSEKLDQYLESMPTMEEHEALQKQVQEITIRCDAATSQLQEKERLIVDILSDLNTKEELIRSLNTELSVTKVQLQETRESLQSVQERALSLEPENSRLRNECHRMQKLVFEGDARCRHELQAMRERHKQRFTEATAKLRTQHKAMAKRTKILEMQLLKNSDAMAALNSELQLSQGTIGELKGSISELVVQNQDLVEKNITLQETSSEDSAAKVAGGVAEAQSDVAQQLATELERCVDDFESLVSLSSSILEGRDPNSSLILGIKVSVSSSPIGLSCYESYEARLEQVRRLQGEVERLRMIISDHFAAEVSSACHLQ